jgi:hypothetical protein
MVLQGAARPTPARSWPAATPRRSIPRSRGLHHAWLHHRLHLPYSEIPSRQEKETMLSENVRKCESILNLLTYTSKPK